MPQLPAGAAAPDFQLPGVNGTLYQLSEGLRSGPLVLVFSKSSCPTCQFTLPYIQRIYSQFGTDRIWVVSQDDAKETTDFARHFGLSFDFLIEEHPYDVSSMYGLEYVPATFIVASDGRIQLSDFGFSKNALNEVNRVVAEESKARAVPLFAPDDKLPPRRPGCRSRN